METEDLSVPGHRGGRPDPVSRDKRAPAIRLGQTWNGDQIIRRKRRGECYDFNHILDQFEEKNLTILKVTIPRQWDEKLLRFEMNSSK